MAELTTPFHKPAFLVGPFLSPFSPTMNSEHIIAVASGIGKFDLLLPYVRLISYSSQITLDVLDISEGITPTLSLIKQYQYTSRRLNFIWMCRDP